MKKWRQWTIAALTMLVVTAIFWGMPQNVCAETVKDAPELHSQQEIIDYIKNHKATMSDKVEYFSDYFIPNYTTPPYSSGELSDKTKQYTLNMINQIRFIAGIPEIEYYSNYKRDMQCAALLSTINQTTSRQQEMPAGMDEDLYYFGARALDWNWVHMALGYENLNTAIVKEWTGNSSTAADMAKLEKRRGILNPKMTGTCFGAVGNAYSIDTRDGLLGYRVNGVAWPAVEMPVEYFDPGFCWSYCMGKWVDPNGVSVILTKESTGQRWYFNKSRTDGYFAVNNDDRQQQGYLIFQPRNLTYAPGDVFSVQIETAADFISYPVEFFSIGDAGEKEFVPLQNGVGKEETVDGKAWLYYSFTAPSDGIYQFTTEGRIIAAGYLYSAKTMKDEELLGYENTHSSTNFKINREMKKGQTVYLEVDVSHTSDNTFKVWACRQQTITYHANGGYKGTQDRVAYYGRPLEFPIGWVAFQKYGYWIEGWYTEPAGGMKIEDNSYIVTGDTTLYAHWEPRTQIGSHPANVTAKVGDQVTFSVAAAFYYPEVDRVAYYQWQYKTATETEWTDVSEVSGKTANYTFTAKAQQNNMQFRCVLQDSYGVKLNSNAAVLTVKMLDKPEISSLSSNATGVRVTWGAVSGAAQYRVFYKTAAGAWKTFGSVKGTGVTVTGLTSGTAYTFLVRCLSADGKEYTSDYDAAKSKSCTYIEQPAVSNVVNTSNGVEVRWKPVSGAAQYRVFYKTATGAWTGFNNTKLNSMVVTGLTAGETYSFTVRCVSADGKSYTSTYDTIGKAILYQPVPMLAKPEITALSSNSTGVHVTWGAVSGAAQYRVFYKTATGAWTAFGNVKGTDTTVTGLISGTTYTFLVRCLSADGKTYTSDYDASKSKSHTYIAQPAVSSVTNTANGVEVKWNAVGGAAQYRVFCKVAGGSWIGYKNTTGTGITVTGLTKGTTYSFTVRCLSADGKTYTSTYDTVGKSITVN